VAVTAWHSLCSQALDVDVGVAEASLASAAGVVADAITSAVTTPAPDDVASASASDGTATSSVAGSGSEAESMSVSGSPSDDAIHHGYDVAAPRIFTHSTGGASGPAHGDSSTTKPTPWHATAQASPLLDVAFSDATDVAVVPARELPSPPPSASASASAGVHTHTSQSQSPPVASVCSHNTATRMHALMTTDLIEGRKLEYDTDVGLLHLFERAGGRVDPSMVEAALASHQGGADRSSDDAGGDSRAHDDDSDVLPMGRVADAALQNNAVIVQVRCREWCLCTVWLRASGCVAAWLRGCEAAWLCRCSAS
jgi:hypothetical protein